MFSRFIRATIQNTIIRSTQCTGTPFKSPIIKNLQNVNQKNFINIWTCQNKWISSVSSTVPLLAPNLNSCTTLFSPPGAKSILNVAQLNNNTNISVRTVIKFSRTKGKRRVVGTVLRRFYRLNWGIWIRTKAGRNNRLWKKRASRRKRLKRHVFCNATQSWLLDKMVSPYWRKPKYWVDDPYTPYHSREEFWITRTKPQP